MYYAEKSYLNFMYSFKLAKNMNNKQKYRKLNKK